MMRTTLLSVLASLTLHGCDKSSPDSASPDDAGAVVSAEPAALESAPEPAADPAPEPEGEDEEPEDEPLPVVATPEGPSPVPADPAVGLTQPTSMATVKLEIKDDGGKVLKDKPRVLRFDETFRIPLELGGRVHELDIEVTREGKGFEVVVVSYVLEGQQLVRNYRMEASANKREVIHIEGGIGLAITVGSKTIKPKPQKERDKVETPAGDDPLAGAER